MSDLEIAPAKMNQAGNTQNPYQGGAPKALCICSAGLLRSPSIAKYLTSKGYNTRACGTSQDYALVPLTQVLLMWAEEIHVVKEQAELVKILLAKYNLAEDAYIYELDIPDVYETFDPTLMLLIEDFYNNN